MKILGQSARCKYLFLCLSLIHVQCIDASQSLVKPLRSSAPALSSLLVKSAPGITTLTTIYGDQQYQSPKISESSYLQKNNIERAQFTKPMTNFKFDIYADLHKIVTDELKKPTENLQDDQFLPLNAQQEAQLQQKLLTMTFSMPKKLVTSSVMKSRPVHPFGQQIGQQTRNYGTQVREYEPVEYSYNNDMKASPATSYNKYVESLQQHISNPLKTSTLYGSALHEAGHATWVIYKQSQDHMIASGSIQQASGTWGNIRIESIINNKNDALTDEDRMNKIKMNLIGIVTQQVLDRSYPHYQPKMLTNVNDIMKLPGEYEGGVQAPKKADTVKVRSGNLWSGDIATIQKNVLDVAAYQHFDDEKDNIDAAIQKDRKPNELHNMFDVNSLIDNQKLVAVISDVYPEVYNFVVQHTKDIVAIADLLYEKGTVSGDEVYKTIKAQHPLKSPFSFDEHREFVGDGQGEFTADGLYKDYYDENRQYLYRYDKNGNDVGLAGTFNKQNQSKYRFDTQGNEVGSQGGYNVFGQANLAKQGYLADYYGSNMLANKDHYKVGNKKSLPVTYELVKL